MSSRIVRKLVCLSIVFLFALSVQSFNAMAVDEVYYKDYRVNNGGLNTKASHFAVKENESPDCQNVNFGEDGAIIQRNGYVALLTTAITGTPKVTGIHAYVQADGDDWLIVTAGSKIYKSDSMTTVSLGDITGEITITPLYLFDFCTFMDTVILTNGVDPPIKWDGSGDAVAAAVPTGLTTAKWVAQFKNYLFYANVTQGGTLYASRIYYSDLMDIGTWDATNYIDVSRDDGEQIKGMEVLGDRLCIFKESKVYELIATGDPDVPFQMIETPGRGCASGYTIFNVMGYLIYLSYDGLYRFDGSYSTIVSDKITPTINEANQSRLADYVAAPYFDNKQYWLCTTATSNQALNNRVIVWDWYNDAFTLYTNIAASYVTTFRVSGKEYMYSGDYYGQLYRQDYGTNDNGTAIDAYYWTAWLDAGAPLGLSKSIKHMYLFLKHTGVWDMSIGYNYDFKKYVWRSFVVSLADPDILVGTAIVGQAVVGGSDGLIKRLDLGGGQGKVIRFKFSNSTLDHYFNIRGYGLYVVGGGYR